MRIKQLYRGVFNYSREVHILRAYAYTARQAWLIMCRRLAKRHGVEPSAVMARFDGKDCTVEIEVEIEEAP